MGVSASQVAPEAASLLLGGVFNSLLPGLRLDNVYVKIIFNLNRIYC